MNPLQVLAEAARMLFELVDKVGLTCIYRFTEPVEGLRFEIIPEPWQRDDPSTVLVRIASGHLSMFKRFSAKDIAAVEGTPPAESAAETNPWSEATDARRRREQVFPIPTGTRPSAMVPDPIPREDFRRLWGDLEDAMPHLNSWQLMTLHSTIGWERDLRNDSPPSGDHWSAWPELRRRTHIDFRWCAGIATDLADTSRATGMFDTYGDRVTIYLDWGSGVRSLTHELTHDDRADGCYYDLGPAGSWERETEERVVSAITEERLASKNNRLPAPAIERVLGLGERP